MYGTKKEHCGVHRHSSGYALVRTEGWGASERRHRPPVMTAANTSTRTQEVPMHPTPSPRGAARARSTMLPLLAVTAVMACSLPPAADARGASSGRSSSASTTRSTSTISSSTTRQPSASRRTSTAAQQRKRAKRVRDRLDYDQSAPVDSGSAAPRPEGGPSSTAADPLLTITERFSGLVIWAMTGMFALVATCFVARTVLGLPAAGGGRHPGGSIGSPPVGRWPGSGRSSGGDWGDGGTGGCSSGPSCGGGGD